jgi:hypothetical protein
MDPRSQGLEGWLDVEPARVLALRSDGVVWGGARPAGIEHHAELGPSSAESGSDGVAAK